MKKGITLLFICTLVLNVFAQDRVVITTETFGDITFGTQTHGADTNFDGTIDIPAPDPVYPGFSSHFDYDFVQAITDLGYQGFTSRNGKTVSYSSDSSVRMNTYVSENNNGYPGHSGSVKMHITPGYRYDGSWDSIGIQGIDLSMYGGTVDSLNIEFGAVKRSGVEPNTADGWGLKVEIDTSDGWMAIDTTPLPIPHDPGTWYYATMPVDLDVTTVDEVSILIWCGDLNQIGIDDVSLVGYGTDIPLLDTVKIVGATTIDTEGGTLQLDVDVVADPPALDSSIIWSVDESTGCASIDADGLVTAIGNGIVTAIATAADGGGAVGTMDITLSNQSKLVETVSVTSAGGYSIDVSTDPGATLQFEAVVLPVCANDLSVTWTVESITGSADISSEGLLTPTANGQVSVVATANDGSDASGSRTVFISGFSDVINIENTEISLYPTPAQNELNITNAAEVNMVEILGINGTVVSTVLNDYNDNVSINVSNLTSGVYFIRLHTSDDTIISKFVKE